MDSPIYTQNDIDGVVEDAAEEFRRINEEKEELERQLKKEQKQRKKAEKKAKEAEKKAKKDARITSRRLLAESDSESGYSDSDEGRDVTFVMKDGTIIQNPSPFVRSAMQKKDIEQIFFSDVPRSTSAPRSTFEGALIPAIGGSRRLKKCKSGGKKKGKKGKKKGKKKHKARIVEFSSSNSDSSSSRGYSSSSSSSDGRNRSVHCAKCGAHNPRSHGKCNNCGKKLRKSLSKRKKNKACIIELSSDYSSS